MVASFIQAKCDTCVGTFQERGCSTVLTAAECGSLRNPLNYETVTGKGGEIFYGHYYMDNGGAGSRSSQDTRCDPPTAENGAKSVLHGFI